MPGPKPTYTARIHMNIEPELKAALEACAEENHAKAAQITREALRAHPGVKRHLETLSENLR